MFERRLKATLSLLAFALAIIVGRLVHLQIVRAEFYRDRTSQMMLREPIVLPFVRGRVLDRTGEILVSDEPCWDLCVDYGVIVLNATAWLDAVPTNSVGNDPWIRLLTMRSPRIAAA
ncbi:MAG: hypothetical protein IIB61_05210, partial [Planctomycetes bacterium]|nr:hypothetical protein [Planctomycetota bacterium]